MLQRQIPPLQAKHQKQFEEEQRLKEKRLASMEVEPKKKVERTAKKRKKNAK